MIPIRSTVSVRSAPLATSLIIAVNTLIFFYQLTLSPYGLHAFIYQYGLVPDRIHVAALFTSMFLHGGWLHLIGNMWFLWVFGRGVEDLVGSGRYLAFYLGCGVIAGLLQYAISPFSRVPTIGASGAIAAVMGAYLIKFPHARIVTLVPIFIFLTRMDLPAALLLIYWFVIQFFSGIGSIGAASYSGGVAWFAHVGGFIAGMLVIRMLKTRPRYSYWDY